MIHFQGSFTRETLLRAVRLTMGRYRLFFWVFGVMIVLSLFGSVFVPLQQGAPFDPVALTAPLLFVVLIGLLLWIPRASVDKLLKTNKLLQEPLEGYADAFQALVREKAPRPRESGGRLLRIFVIWAMIVVAVLLVWAFLR